MRVRAVPDNLSACLPSVCSPRLRRPETSLTEIRRLLVQAFEGGFSEDDWEHTIGGWHVVVADGGVALSHAAVVPRVLEVADRPLHAGYVEGVATAPVRQRQGLGSLAMAEVSELLRSEFEMGAPLDWPSRVLRASGVGTMAGPNLRSAQLGGDPHRRRG